MAQLEVKKKKRNIYGILFVVLLSILIVTRLAESYFYTPNPDLYLKKWIIKRIGGLFFNNLTGAVVIIGILIYFYGIKKCELAFLKKSGVRFLVIACLVLAGFILSNLGQKEEYIVDGDKKNRFEIIALMLKDYKEQEKETITVDSFEVISMNVHFSGVRPNNGHMKKEYYVRLDEKKVVLADDQVAKRLSDLANLVQTTEFTVYKNSKMIHAIDGIPVEDFSQILIETSPRFQIDMDEKGNIDINQVVITKDLGDISDQCQLCFEREGKIVLGVHVELDNPVEAAQNLEQGEYEVYVKHGSRVCSNRIRFKKTEKKEYIIINE